MIMARWKKFLREKDKEIAESWRRHELNKSYRKGFVEGGQIMMIIISLAFILAQF